MFPYVTCSCGFDLASIYPLWAAIRAQRLAAKYGNVTDRAMIQASSDLNVEFGDVLNDLGVHRVCCRTKLLTQMQFRDYY